MNIYQLKASIVQCFLQRGRKRSETNGQEEFGLIGVVPGERRRPLYIRAIVTLFGAALESRAHFGCGRIDAFYKSAGLGILESF